MNQSENEVVRQGQVRGKVLMVREPREVLMSSERVMEAAYARGAALVVSVAWRVDLSSHTVQVLVVGCNPKELPSLPSGGLKTVLKNMGLTMYGASHIVEISDAANLDRVVEALNRLP